MTKSLNKRCIRRWKVRFKGMCDSKASSCWRKHHLRGYIRECGLITAYSMAESMAYNNAKADFGITGWSPEFHSWYDERRKQYYQEAMEFLCKKTTNDEIDEEIDNELEAWND